MTIDWAMQREHMVNDHLIARGIDDARTLSAMRVVPRHVFVPKAFQDAAYEDYPLPIGGGQTISQPYIVALMTQAARLQPNDRVLDVGTGSGYAAAILSQMCADVYSIERRTDLATQAWACFNVLGFKNIKVKAGDGTLGWSEAAPFDAIIVTASSPSVPETLLKQLKVGGRLIIPVGDASGQALLRLTRLNDSSTQTETLEMVRFVPLIGEEGWSN